MNTKPLLIALVLALFGTALIALYMHRFEVEMSGGDRVELLAVVKPIERGTKITDDMLASRSVPVAYVEDRAVKAIERSKVLGLESSTTLSPQQTLMWTDLAITTENYDLSALVQPGKRGVTVRATAGMDSTQGNALIHPGDYVDVIVTMEAEGAGSDGKESSIVLLQRVLVLAVGQETQAAKTSVDGKRDSGGRRDKLLTLSLSLPEAQLLALALERGRLSVAVRNAKDPAVQGDIPDLKASALFDTKARSDVQHPPASNGPVRIEGTALR
jgi:pilus assembly protein CpaB